MSKRRHVKSPAFVATPVMQASAIEGQASEMTSALGWVGGLDISNVELYGQCCLNEESNVSFVSFQNPRSIAIKTR